MKTDKLSDATDAANKLRTMVAELNEAIANAIVAHDMGIALTVADTMAMHIKGTHPVLSIDLTLKL